MTSSKEDRLLEFQSVALKSASIHGPIIFKMSANPINWDGNIVTTPPAKPKLNSVTDKSYYVTSSVSGNALTPLIKPHGVLLEVKGTIGDQLFEYACHYGLARKHNVPLYIRGPISSFLPGNTTGHLAPSLGAFKVPIHSWNTINESNPLADLKLVHISSSNLLSQTYSTIWLKDSFLSLSQGENCRSEIYFAPYKNEVKSLFAPKTNSTGAALWWGQFIEMEGQIGETVAVFLDPGDFHQENDPLYYASGISEILRTLRDRNNDKIGPISVYVFGDDLNFLRHKLLRKLNHSRDDYSFHVVSNLTKLQEFQVATKCKHFIISTRTFSWWVAYLAKWEDKIVIAPHWSMTAAKVSHFSDDLESELFYQMQYRYLYYPLEWRTIQ
ncbi:O-antigen biosynthesis glycosyltransferase WbnK [Folsomia candida]|uniref:L-Fucosyltransferase n=1 Tax=Folsomia candida TaxID=158441 RepID=A0A226DQR6_FOLCA|nr:O-antigen biosynthesis glycosyltransferase WbnK [Folsomia candida]